MGNRFSRSALENNAFSRRTAGERIKQVQENEDQSMPSKTDKNSISIKRKWKSTVKNLCEEVASCDDGSENEDTIHKLEEKWTKKPVNRNKRLKKAGTYQQPPKHEVHFAATQSEKDAIRKKREDIKKATENIKIEPMADALIDHSYTHPDCYAEAQNGLTPEQKAESNYNESEVLESCSESAEESVISSSEEPGFSFYKNRLYDEVVRQCGGPMDKVKDLLQERWCKLSQFEKEKYMNEADSNNDPCTACGNTDPPRSNGKRGLEHWVLCYVCLQWYHQKCVLLDKHFCDKIESYFCPTCAKTHLNGFTNWLFKFRFKSKDELGSEIEFFSKEWVNLSGEQRAMIKRHSFPSLPVYKKQSIGPLQVLSKRGIRNKCNVCYLNSLMQVFCGSVIYRLFEDLPFASPVLKLLFSIHEDLCWQLEDQLDFTDEMKTPKTLVTAEGKESNVLWDTFECMTTILSSITGTPDYSSSDFEGIFDMQSFHFRKCLTCNEVKGNVENSYCIYLPVGNSNYNNSNVQSLIWDWCTISQRNHVGRNCNCEAKVGNFTHRSFLMHCPAVLTIVLDRNVFNKTTSSGLLNYVPINVPEKLDIKNILVGSTANNNQAYSFVAVINFKGRTNIIDGHYTCTLFGENDMAIEFNDSNVRRISKEKFMASKFLQTTSRILFYVKEELLLVDNLIAPWNRSPDNNAIEELESYWFGLADFKSTNLSIHDIAPLTGDNEMTSDVMYYFLREITAEATDDIISGILPTQFLTALVDGSKSNRTLCRGLMQARTSFDGDLLLIPYHQRNHWSIIGVFLKENTIVHCDSIASKRANEVAFKSVLQYVSKAFAYLKRSFNMKRFKLVSLSDAGLQQQTDSTSCGIFACVFGYSLLHLEDHHARSSDLTNLRYWIANKAIKGADREEQRPFRCSDQLLWDNMPYVEERLPRETKITVGRSRGPFSSLRKFLEPDKGASAPNCKGCYLLYIVGTVVFGRCSHQAE